VTISANQNAAYIFLAFEP